MQGLDRGDTTSRLITWLF
ncbi:hypothetical protein Zm00014a_027356 [Zea mays]|uniref:Uncharacterized protein n=1 Tax=Zea mays TaxID=4577 RepID=A0A3L6FTR4_MAIZE|nr:hypothetical protein Zm00014a_027356 [Zea mays]